MALLPSGMTLEQSFLASKVFFSDEIPRYYILLKYLAWCAIYFNKWIRLNELGDSSIHIVHTHIFETCRSVLWKTPVRVGALFASIPPTSASFMLLPPHLRTCTLTGYPLLLTFTWREETRRLQMRLSLTGKDRIVLLLDYHDHAASILNSSGWYSS